MHQTDIITNGFRSLAEVEPVEFVKEAGDDGRTRAVQVTGPNGAPPQGQPRHVVVWPVSPRFQEQ